MKYVNDKYEILICNNKHRAASQTTIGPVHHINIQNASAQDKFQFFAWLHYPQKSLTFKKEILSTRMKYVIKIAKKFGHRLFPCIKKNEIF